MKFNVGDKVAVVSGSGDSLIVHDVCTVESRTPGGKVKVDGELYDGERGGAHRRQNHCRIQPLGPEHEPGIRLNAARARAKKALSDIRGGDPYARIDKMTDASAIDSIACDLEGVCKAIWG